MQFIYDINTCDERKYRDETWMSEKISITLWRLWRPQYALDQRGGLQQITMTLVEIINSYMS